MVCLYDLMEDLADRLVLDPGGCTSYFKCRFVVINVISYILQGGLWVSGGKLGGFLNFLSHFNVNFLQQTAVVLHGGQIGHDSKQSTEAPINHRSVISNYTFSSSTLDKLLLSILSFSRVMGSLLLLTS